MIMSNLIMPMGPPLPRYVQMLSSNIASAWTSWNSGLKWGALSVVGAGIGAWSGSGAGGAIIQGPPLSVPYTPFYKGTEYDKKFQNTLAEVLKMQFTLWAASYKFAGVPFLGPCSATPLSPGVFSANNLPTPLVAAGNGQVPNASQIVNLWKPQLIANGFNLSAEGVQTVKLMDAIAKGVVMAFQTVYLTTSNVTGSSAFGPATPSVGVGSGVSTPSGSIV